MTRPSDAYPEQAAAGLPRCVSCAARIIEREIRFDARGLPFCPRCWDDGQPDRFGQLLIVGACCLLAIVMVCIAAWAYREGILG